jgi:putative ABC transport system permease protein
MNLGSMAWRYVWARPWVTALTLLGLALGTALPCAILLVRQQAEGTLLREGEGVDLVVGAKGSPLQLVLSTIHHLDLPTGNIPLSMVDRLRGDKRVEAVVPLGLGDNLDGFRIVGTSDDFLAWRPRGADTWVSVREGRWFSEAFEVVVGAEAAKRLELRLDDTFVGAHGLVAAPGSDHHDFPYTVVGILGPSGMAVDRLILTPMESVWSVHEAEKKVHANLFGMGGAPAKTEREVTAVWLRLRGPGLRMWMREEINIGSNAMAAVPVEELLRLYQRVLRPVERGMLWMSAAVAAVSLFAILATVLQSTERRLRDWAVLRALGARPREVFALVWMESFWITGAGVLLGLALAHGGLAMAFRFFAPEQFLSFRALALAEGELWVLAVVWLGGGLFGLLPAVWGYRRSPVADLSRD